MDAVGNSELRQRPTAAGCGHWTRGEPGPVSEYSRGLGIFVETGLAPFLRRGDDFVEGVDAASRGSTGNSGMLTKEKAADIFDRVLCLSSAYEVEATFTGSPLSLSRFA